MKRFMIWIMAFCFILSTVAPVWGQTEKTGVPGKPGGIWQVETGEKVVVETETIPKDLIFNGELLEVDGVVQGDLIVLSGDVTINGKVEGSIIGFTAGKLTVNGFVGRNLRVLAQELYINGNVEGSATVGAFQMITSPNSRVGNGLMGAFLVLELAGQVDQMTEISSWSVTKIGGRINGDLNVKGNQLEWVSPLVVTGKVIDSSILPSNPSKIKGIEIGGYQFSQGDSKDLYQNIMAQFTGIFLWLAGSLLLSLLFFRLFPRTTWSMTEPTVANFRRSLLLGLISLVGIPVVFFLLLLTGVGIPIAFFLLFLYLLLLIGFEIPVCLWLGRVIFKSKLRPGLTILLGAVFQMIIFVTPLINIVSIPLFICMGMGMIAGKIRFQFRETIDNLQ